MGILTNYITEKINEVRYVSVDDDGVTKKKLILKPRDTARIELDVSTVDPTVFARKADFGVLFPVPTVKHFGAVGDGVVDDTIAIQAAINANREVVFPEPSVRYKASQLVLRGGSRLIGEGRTIKNDDPVTQIDSTVVGLTGTPAAIRIEAGSVDFDSGVVIENLWIKGHASETQDWTHALFPSWGIRGGSQINALKVLHSIISGFNVNVELINARHCTIDHSTLRNAVNANLIVQGGCDHIVLNDSEFIVVNEAGTAHVDAVLSNIWARVASGLYPKWMSIRDCTIDEVARNGQTATPVTLRLDRVEDSMFEMIQMYYPVGATGGNGVGLLIGPSSKRASFKRIRVAPYVANNTHVPLNTIQIDALASGIVLEDITTDPNTANGGADINDLSTDTTYRNVNGNNVTPGVGSSIKLRAGSYFGPDFSTVSTQALNTGALAYAVPVEIPRNGTINQISIEVTTAGDATSVIRLGIYKDNGSGYPGARLIDAGVVDSSSTGVKNITISQPVTSGLYWLVAVHQVGATPANVRSGSSPRFPVRPTSWSTSTVSSFRDVSGAMTGALPATFSSSENVNPTGPIIRVRFA